ncbi:hypothetical protein M0804_011916 [Polistes exclamans]|nr:hypothetical protein M0804_011916 [Polistes exclamans]
MIDRLTIYYGLAIRMNCESIKKMKDAIWATYFHYNTTDKKPQHDKCPYCEVSKCLISGDSLAIGDESCTANCLGHGHKQPSKLCRLRMMRKSVKWWRKLFFWGLEICSINSYIIYKSVKKQRNERPLIHLQYLKTLVDQLRGEFRQKQPSTASSSQSSSEVIRLNRKLQVILMGQKKDCKCVCELCMAARGRRGRQAEEEERVQGAEFQALASLVKELREELHYQRGKLEEQERRKAELSARLKAGPQLSIPSCSRGDFLEWERRETGQMIAAERPRQREVGLGIGSGRVEVTGSGYAVKPDTYDGEGNLGDFLSHFELVARANSWDESARALALATSLRGEARAVLQAFGDREEFSFAALKSRLELRYGERLNQQKSYTEFASRRQKAGEDLAVIAADLERLARFVYSECTAETEDKIACGQFLNAIRDPEVRTALKVEGVKSLRVAAVRALELEAIYGARSSEASRFQRGEACAYMSMPRRQDFNAFGGGRAERTTERCPDGVGMKVPYRALEKDVVSRRQANYSGGKKPVLGKACCPGGKARLWKRGNVEPKKASERMLTGASAA